MSTVKLSENWEDWSASDPVEVLRPEREYEGANFPVKASENGRAHGQENALRDPFLFKDGNDLWLYYSVAGERGIAAARLQLAKRDD